MEFIKFLLRGHLILIFVTAFSPDQDLNAIYFPVVDEYVTNFRLPDRTVPTDYSVKLVLDIERDIFHGVSNVSIIVRNSTRHISLQAGNLEIIEATLTQDVEGHTLKDNIHKFSYLYEQQIIILHVGFELFPKKYVLNMAFTGNIANNKGGFFKTSYTNNEGQREWILTTHNSATGMRHLFPCWDEPGFKANFSISLKFHNNYTAFSNMPIVNSRLLENDTKVMRFATTPAISTYQVAIVMFRKLSSLMNYKLWGRQQTTQYLKYASSVIENVIRNFNNEYLYIEDCLTEICFVIPGLLDDSINKLQLIFFREDNIIYNEEIDPITHKIEVSRLIVRKIAGQLIGSVISLSWWSQMWLYEGVATLLGIDLMNKIFPDFRMMDLFVVQTQQESLHLDDEQIMTSLTSKVNNMFELNSLFTFAYYLKGPAILRMLQHILHKQVYQEGINIYLKRDSASPNDFWAAMQSAHDKAPTDNIEKFNIREMIEPWTKKTHYPVLNIIKYVDYDIIVNISLENAPETRWIPLTWSIQVHSNFNRLWSGFWLKRTDSSAFYGFEEGTSKNGWVIFNTQQTGYYRVNYDKDNWIRIARFLNSENYTEIHVLNRAQIIDDAFHFMMSGKLNSSIFWELTSYLSQETDYVAWYPMLKAIERMSYIYPFHESQHLKIMILGRLYPLLNKIKYQEYPDENHLLKCLRQEAVKWTCVFGDADCKKVANLKLKSHLTDSTNNKLLPWWRNWMYCNGLSTADNVTINRLVSVYMEDFFKENYTNVHEFLTCSNSLDIIPIFKKLIKFIQNDYSSISGRVKNLKKKGYISMFYSIIERHANNNLVLHYILTNWKKIKPKGVSTVAALINIINHIYFPPHLYKIMQFVKGMELEPPTINMNHSNSTSELAILTKQKINHLIQRNFITTIISYFRNKINVRLSEIKRYVDLFVSTYII